VESPHFNSKIFLVIRYIFAIYATIILTASIALTYENGFWLVYFTHLTYFGLTVYFWSVSTHTFLYLRRGDFSSLTNNRGRLYSIWILYEMLVTYHIIVPVVYWFALASPQPNVVSTWVNVSVHGMDLTLMAFEFFLNQIPVVRTHVIPMLIVAILYCAYTWVVHAIPYGPDGIHRWVYPFLSWDSATSAVGWYLGLFIAFIVIYFFCFGIHKLRDHAIYKVKERERNSIVE